MALFQSDLKDIVHRLSAKDFASLNERDELLARLAATEGLRAHDVVWMLFRPDRVMRESAVKLLGQIGDAETVDAFVAEARGKTEQALRAATISLSGLAVPGLEQRVSQMLAPAPKETKESREMQAIGRRILLDSPVTEATEPLLWQVASAGATEERLQFIAKLATAELSKSGLARWRHLASDPEQAIRDRALEVLAARAPQTAVDLFIEELPTASESTRAVLAEALARVAAAQGVQIAEKLLPLIASGDASTRTAVMKILIGIGDPAVVLKRYIRFANTLAGFVRARTLESIAAFRDELLQATIELLRDPDPDIRSGAISVASAFEDPRITPATIELLSDSDWWIRISAADTLGKLKDPRAVEALIAALADAEVRWSAVEALGRIADARALPALGKMLADPAPDIRIEVLQALRNFNHPQVKNALMEVAQKDPDRNVRARAIDLLDELSPPGDPSRAHVDAIRAQALAASSAKGDPRLNKLLVATRNQGGSDFHLTVGQPPMVRLAADLLRAQGDAFTAETTEAMLKEILTETQWATLQREHQLDFCHFIPQAGRYRANVFFDQRGYNAVFRVIPEKPPTISEIGLSAHLSEIADYHQGLVMICGPSGSGKSTTLAALVNLFNETRSDHVLTMEDPVEFVPPVQELSDQSAGSGNAHGVVRASAAGGITRGPGRDRHRRVARQRIDLPRADRGGDRSHRPRHAQFDERAKGGRSCAVEFSGRRATAGARLAFGVFEVRHCAAAASVDRAAKASGRLRDPQGDELRGNDDPRRENFSDLLGDADRQIARDADLRRGAARSGGTQADRPRNGVHGCEQERRFRIARSGGVPEERAEVTFEPSS